MIGVINDPGGAELVTSWLNKINFHFKFASENTPKIL